MRAAVRPPSSLGCQGLNCIQKVDTRLEMLIIEQVKASVRHNALLLLLVVHCVSGGAAGARRGAAKQVIMGDKG